MTPELEPFYAHDGHATPTLAALYQAVVQSPSDDTVRLAYADECQDYDPGRAEFIRAQFRLAEVGPPPKRIEAKNLTFRGRLPVKNASFRVTASVEDGLRAGDRVDLICTPYTFESAAVESVALEPGSGVVTLEVSAKPGRPVYDHAEVVSLNEVVSRYVSARVGVENRRAGNFPIQYHKGFYSAVVHVAYAHWRAVGGRGGTDSKTLCLDYPIRTVWFSDPHWSDSEVDSGLRLASLRHEWPLVAEWHWPGIAPKAAAAHKDLVEGRGPKAKMPS